MASTNHLPHYLAKAISQQQRAARQTADSEERHNSEKVLMESDLLIEHADAVIERAKQLCSHSRSIRSTRPVHCSNLLCFQEDGK